MSSVDIRFKQSEVVGLLADGARAYDKGKPRDGNPHSLIDSDIHTAMRANFWLKGWLSQAQARGDTLGLP